MKLRNQLLTLSLVTVLVPLFGWKLVQELEQYLRAGQESALLASARTVALALPAEYQSLMLFGRDRAFPVRELDARPVVDGYQNDWPEAANTTRFSSADGELGLQLMLGRFEGAWYLFARVTDTTAVREQVPGSDPLPAGVSRPDADGITLFIRSARGLNHFRIRSAAPGPLLVPSQAPGGGQLRGHWQETSEGYHLELALPATARAFDLSIGAIDISPGRSGTWQQREAGTLRDQRPAQWLSPAGSPPGLEAWLQAVVPSGSRAWILDQQAWVVAETLPAQPPQGEGARTLTWVERAIYRAISRSPTEPLAERGARLIQFTEPWLQNVFTGSVAQVWGQDIEKAEVRHTVAVPLVLADRVRGAVVMEARSDGLALVTNRALGRLLLTTLAVTFLLAGSLWFFATRLSRRVQRLSGAVSEAMDDGSPTARLPLVDDGDELGDLARNNERLLRSVADYNGYLQKLAGRLSHELKTPLAITRSSLENLATSTRDAEANRYLARAREGVERQSVIIRAMSEASRLEASVQSADWETIDLKALLDRCAEAYRSLYAGRTLALNLPDQPCLCRCIPDLLVQALDKLVDNAMGLTDSSERVELALEPKGNYFHIRVFNSGTRLPDTLQDQLFDSLVSVREPDDGQLHLGLGLHIVRLVAQAHQGRVEASNVKPAREAGGQSERVSGVVFTLSLPAR